MVFGANFFMDESIKNVSVGNQCLQSGTSLVPETMSEISNTNQEGRKDEIKLIIKFEMTSALKDAPERKLTMTLLQGDIKTYQMFFAYFKKKLINSFAV